MTFEALVGKRVLIRERAWGRSVIEITVHEVSPSGVHMRVTYAASGNDAWIEVHTVAHVETLGDASAMEKP